MTARHRVLVDLNLILDVLQQGNHFISYLQESWPPQKQV